MTEGKSMLLLASVAALTLAVHESALSAPPADESAPPPAVATGPAPEIGKSAAAESIPASPEVAPSAPLEPGVAAPKSPPPAQTPKSETCRCQLGGMSPEERRAYRKQRFQSRREQAMKRRQGMTERWDAYQKILDAMTPEQKEAVRAVFGRGQKGRGHRGRGRQMPPGMPMQPDLEWPEFGYPAGPGFPGPGYGYGPQSVQPYPFEKNPATPAGGAQSGNGGD